MAGKWRFKIRNLFSLLRQLAQRSHHHKYQSPTPRNADHPWVEGLLCAKCQNVIRGIEWYLGPGKGFESRTQFDHQKNLRDLYISANEGCHLCSLIFGAALPLQGASSKLMSSMFDNLDSGTSALIIAEKLYELDRNTLYSVSIAHAVSDYAKIGDMTVELGGPREAVLELVLNGLPSIDTVYIMPTTRGNSSPGMLAGTSQDSGAVPNAVLCQSTGDFEALDLARWWLKTCIAKHTECSDNISTASLVRPARLLQLNFDAGDTGLQLVEVESLPSTPVYLTLSYVWGGQGAVRLEMASLESMKTKIDLASLPRTIREAVKTTRILGYRYIWVDSLCIIQDSATDWAVEAAKMGSIYWHSILTLGALHASGNQEGLFHKRNPLYFRGLSIKGHDFEVTNTSNLGILEFDSPSAPLQTRAWVVQERLMARRTLFFGCSGLFWECACCVASDVDVLGVQMRTDMTGPANLKSAFSKIVLDKKSTAGRMPGLVHLNSTWSQIRLYYTSCNLTYEKDRPVAISGVMSFLASVKGFQPAHGMWLDIIVRELCWEVDDIGQRPSQYDAPSWSWLSVGAHIKDVIRPEKYAIMSDRSAILIGAPDSDEPAHACMDSEQGRSLLQDRPAGCLTLLVHRMWRVQLFPGQKLKWGGPISRHDSEGADEPSRNPFSDGDLTTNWHQDVMLDPLPAEAIWIHIAHCEVSDGRTADVGIIAIETDNGMRRIGIKKITSRDFDDGDGRKIFSHGQTGRSATLSRLILTSDRIVHEPSILVRIV